LKTGIVIQGPHRGEFLRESLSALQPVRGKFHVVVSTWEGQNTSDLGGLADEVVLSRPPAFAGAYNLNLQSVSSVAGLRACSRAGVRWAIKSRTDFRLSREYLEQVAPKLPSGKVVATNLFTKLVPFHLSDMVLGGEVAVLRDYFDLTGPGASPLDSPRAEVAFTRQLVRRRYPAIDADNPTMLGWMNFLSRHVSLLDYSKTGIVWEKCRDITQHCNWHFDRDIESIVSL
jgi:hypothetical protein